MHAGIKNYISIEERIFNAWYNFGCWYYLYLYLTVFFSARFFFALVPIGSQMFSEFNFISLSVIHYLTLSCSSLKCNNVDVCVCVSSTIHIHISIIYRYEMFAKGDIEVLNECVPYLEYIFFLAYIYYCQFVSCIASCTQFVCVCLKLRFTIVIFSIAAIVVVFSFYLRVKYTHTHFLNTSM